MNFQNDKMGRLEGALEITEHTGFQTVSYKLLGSMGMQLSVKAAGTLSLLQADPGHGQ